MMMTAVEHEQMLNFQKALSAALSAAACLRSEWQVAIPTRYGTELAWVGRERELLMTMVNDRQAQRGQDPITEDEVHEVEESASGHSDYAHKYTLRLAKLAYGVEWKP